MTDEELSAIRESHFHPPYFYVGLYEYEVATGYYETVAGQEPYDHHVFRWRLDGNISPPPYGYRRTSTFHGQIKAGDLAYSLQHGWRGVELNVVGKDVFGYYALARRGMLPP